MSTLKVKKAVISMILRVYRLSTKNTGDKAVRLSLLTVGNAKEIRRSGLVQRRAAAPYWQADCSVSAVCGHLRCGRVADELYTARRGTWQSLILSLPDFSNDNTFATTHADTPQYRCANTPQRTYILRLLLAILLFFQATKNPATLIARFFAI